MLSLHTVGHAKQLALQITTKVQNYVLTGLQHSSRFLPSPWDLYNTHEYLLPGPDLAAQAHRMLLSQVLSTSS